MQMNGKTTIQKAPHSIRFVKRDLYAFVGLDRYTGNITTFHIKDVGEIARLAPSLGMKS